MLEFYEPRFYHPNNAKIPVENPKNIGNVLIFHSSGTGKKDDHLERDSYIKNSPKTTKNPMLRNVTD